MADTPGGIDIPALLAPLPGETPIGRDLRQDYSGAIYFPLRDARRDARAAERRINQGRSDDDPQERGAVDPTAVVYTNWRTVLSLSVTALTEQTKDLEIAAWLTEALVRVHGLPGLIAGSQVLTGLVEQFWDTPAGPSDSDEPTPPGLYPLPDEDGMETRLAPVSGLSGREKAEGTLLQPLRLMPLYKRPDTSEMSYFQYAQSAELPTLSEDRQKQRTEAGTVPFETVELEMRLAGAVHLGALRDLLDQALAAWAAMDEAFTARAGRDAPSTGAVSDLLTAMRDAVAPYAGAVGAGADGAAAGAGTVPDMAAGGTMAGSVPAVAAPSVGFPSANLSAGPSATREDALRLLGEIAAFFKRTEPHSPLSYTLQEAVRRGRMSLPELLAEVVPDYAARSAILSSLGIKPPPETEE